jgi:glycosyltransferase involved in cell wall biosynthesis
MATELSVDSRRIAVMPLGVPVYPGFRRPVRLGSDLTVLYLGRLEKRKGTCDLIHAIPQVLGEVPQARFVFIGKDRPHCPGNRTHAQYIRDELVPEVRERIRLEGQLNDQEVDRRLQTADLFVAPSLYESFGLVFLEAMRWGTPVIGTRVGGIPEIVEDGKTGLLVAAECPGELAKAIIALLRNEQRRRDLGEAGRRHVETSFNIERMAKRAAELYARTIRDGHG